MQLFQGIEQIPGPFPGAVITIGNFDGVHIGHQALFRQVVQKADAIGGTSVAMTFEPHPLRALKKNHHPPLITLYEQKVELISKTGVDVLICVPFTASFASISAEAFVQGTLVQKIGVKVIVVGPDYSFGKARQGNVHSLKKLSKGMDLEIVEVPWIATVGGTGPRISSTRIRELVIEGSLEEASALLGRHYQVRGVVVRGRNRGGKLLGFPTANIQLQDELCPKQGVYAVTVEYDGRTYNGVANIGYSPTFDDQKFTVEVHLLGFQGDLYGSKIRVNFVQRLRGEMRFPSIDDLVEQIGKDIETARGILSP